MSRASTVDNYFSTSRYKDIGTKYIIWAFLSLTLIFPLDFVLAQPAALLKGTMLKNRGRGGGQVVSVLAFYSDHLSSNTAEA